MRDPLKKKRVYPKKRKGVSLVVMKMEYSSDP